MFLLRSFVITLLFSGCVVTHAQEKNSSENAADSLREARQRDYQERLRKFNETNRIREKDPKRFADSVQKISNDRKFEVAMKRIAVYQNDEDIASLKEIDLTDAGLDSIPPFVFAADSLEVLVLDRNKIRKLPKELNDLSNLERIYWRSNDLGGTRPKIERIEGIKKLDISNNHLKKLPKVHRLKGVEELVLESNEFEKIPIWGIRKMKQLKELELSQNPIQIEKRWYWLINDLEVLKLNKCKLEGYDPSLYQMKGLKELQFQVNEIDEIPEGIGELKQLNKISFYKNRLKELPSDFYLLENLRVVDLYYNQLEVIPDDFGKLSNIRILYLSFNKVYDLTEELGKLEKLSELYIHHNRLSEIPVSIKDLDSLRTLHFQSNYLQSFPSHLKEMRQLRDLDISFNQIGDIPLEVESLDLRSFYWRGLEIDLEDPDNYPVRDMILRMIKDEVVVSPRVVTEQVEMEGQY